jgi:hypothetical protein
MRLIPSARLLYFSGSFLEIGKVQRRGNDIAQTVKNNSRVASALGSGYIWQSTLLHTSLNTPPARTLRCNDTIAATPTQATLQRLFLIPLKRLKTA